VLKFPGEEVQTTRHPAPTRRSFEDKNRLFLRAHYAGLLAIQCECVVLLRFLCGENNSVRPFFGTAQQAKFNRVKPPPCQNPVRKEVWQIASSGKTVQIWYKSVLSKSLKRLSKVDPPKKLSNSTRNWRKTCRFYPTRAISTYG